MRHVSLLFATSLVAVVLSGCPNPQTDCSVSSDCAADEICNADGVCVATSEPEPTPEPTDGGGDDPCEGITCSGQGSCALSGGEAICVCNTGYSPVGTECIEDVDSCDGVDCSGNGTCAIANDVAVCSCDPGYEPMGLACVEVPDPCAGITCTGQGACAVQDDVAICVCNDGFVPKGTECVSEEDPCAAITCSGYGTCVTTDDTPSCDCDDGYVPNGLTCIGADDPCAGQNCSDHGTCTATNDTVTCDCDDGYRAEGLSCVEDIQLGDGGTVVPGVPEEWTCAPNQYGDGTCDCGCGVVDSDCANEEGVSCETNNCFEGQPNSAKNFLCVPNDWTCFGNFYGDGECDCGCGVKDFDCPVTNTLDVCEYELCDDFTWSPKPGTNYLCFPPEWTCNGDLYDEENGACDCGCGILDPDCDDSTLASCETCGAEGSCSEGSGCPGGVDPTDNASCDCTPVCTGCRTAAESDMCGGMCQPNCSGTCNGDVCEGGIDLVATELSSTTMMITAGTDLTLRYGYENRGGTAAGAFTFAFYLREAGSTDETLMQTFSRLNLDPQETGGPYSLLIPIDINLTPGSYEIRMALDHQDAVSEDDETNNDIVFAFTVLESVPPDLVITSLSANTTIVQPGGQVLVTYTRANEGGSATPSFEQGFFLSSDAIITASDLNQGSSSRPSLAPGESLTFTNVPVQIGSNTPPGSYYLGVLLDVDGVVDESDETNNFRSVQIVVEDSGLPDLRPLGFRVTTTEPVAPGGTLGVSYSRTNQGTGTSSPFRFSARISENDVLTTADEEVFGLNVSGLSGGQTVGPFNLNIDVPNHLKGGYYFAGVIVDDTSVVTETNEANNSAHEVFLVVPDTCDKYLQYAKSIAGQDAPGLYTSYRDGSNCSKANGDFRPCHDNEAYDDANDLGDFSDWQHSDSFPSFAGAFPDDEADDEDLWYMHVEDRFGATLRVEMSAFVEEDAGGIEMTVTYVCDSGGTSADAEVGDCSSTTVTDDRGTDRAAVECLAAGAVGTTRQDIDFKPGCNGFDESGDVYVHVRRVTDTGCYPYVVEGHF